MTREEWLTRLTDSLRPAYKAAGFPLPEKLRVSCGWPSRSGTGRSTKRIGECWSGECSGDGTMEIFISPVLATVVEVADTLTHELVHAAVGTKCGHRGAFVAAMRKVGLEGKPKQAGMGAALRAKVEPLAKSIGTYPHAVLDVKGRQKQTTRMLKAECPACGYTIRLTRKWAASGLPTCPCGDLFSLDAATDDQPAAVKPRPPIRAIVSE